MGSVTDLNTTGITGTDLPEVEDTDSPEAKVTDNKVDTSSNTTDTEN